MTGTTVIKFDCLRTCEFREPDPVDFSGHQFNVQGADHFPGDLVLHLEDIIKHPVKALGQHSLLGAYIDQLDRDPHPGHRPAGPRLQST